MDFYPKFGNKNDVILSEKMNFYFVIFYIFNYMSKW